MKFLAFIWSNLRRRKLRTALTLLSIFVAFVLFGFLMAITEAFTVGVTMANADRLVTRHKVSIIQTLPVSYENRIASLPGVAAVMHQTWFGGIYQEPKNFFATIPVEPEKFFDMYPEFVLPEDQKQAWLRQRNGAIVGRTLADRFGWKVGTHVPLTSPIWGQPANQDAWDFEIMGIFTADKKNTDTSGMYFRYDYFEEARQRNKGQVGWYIVRVKDAGQAAEVAKQIDAQFENSPHETKSEPEGAFAAGFAQQVGDIGAIMTAVLSAVFFTILLIAGNTMSQSVRERTEELGVLKAMGYPSRLVMLLVLGESCSLALLGGVAGIACAWGLLAAGNPVPNLLPVFHVPNRALVIGLALAVVLGLVTGLLPALSALRLRIAEALRRNG